MVYIKIYTENIYYIISKNHLFIKFYDPLVNINKLNKFKNIYNKSILYIKIIPKIKQQNINYLFVILVTVKLSGY